MSRPMMDHDAFLERLSRDTVRQVGASLRSLYFGGSRAIGAGIPSSDWDLFGIVEDTYDFDGEEARNSSLSEAAGEPVRLRGIAASELADGPQHGTLTKYIPLPVLLRGLPSWRHLAGKPLAPEDIIVRPATAREELAHDLARLLEHREAAERGELPFAFGDYLKTFLMLVESEQELRGHPFTLDYREVARREKDRAHLAHRALAMRNGMDLGRGRFLAELDTYLAAVKRAYKSTSD
ncbi:MAG: hypothetical protein QF415_09460 [Candidatus Undinarchaeales archaeon]|nr:hypothetical protein [Candidatus Undinarchaeales archaeon]MDP7493509.1 hypothetical protein [Candidatus Undinarchaeales archaeon]